MYFGRGIERHACPGEPHAAIARLGPTNRNDRAMLDVTGGEYYVTGLLSADPQARENILRADGSFTVRIFDRMVSASGMPYPIAMRIIQKGPLGIRRSAA